MHLSVVAKFGVKWPSECLLNIVWFWGQKDSLCGTHHSRLFCPSISWTLSLLDLCTSAKFGPDWLRLAGVSPGRLIFRHPCIQAFSLHKQSVFGPSCISQQSRQDTKCVWCRLRNGSTYAATSLKEATAAAAATAAAVSSVISMHAQYRQAFFARNGI